MNGASQRIHQGSRYLRRIRRPSPSSLHHERGYSFPSSSSRQFQLQRCYTAPSSSFAAAAAASSTASSLTTTQQFHSTSNASSDNLLGHSPMARATPNNSSSSTTVVTPKPISPFGVDSNNTGGGIWEQTSTKKTKLNELLTELTERGIDTGIKGMETLDDAAVGEERLDLDLVNGLKVLVKIVDNNADGGGGALDADVGASSQYENEVIDTNIEHAATQATTQLFKTIEAQEGEEWDKDRFESKMKEAIRILSEGCCLPNNVLEKPIAGSLDVSHPFCYLRQFVVESSDDVDTGATATATADSSDDLDPSIQQQIDTLNNITTHALTSSTKLYRTLLLRATAQTLLDNWDQLTTITSGDIDRAAISKTELPSSSQWSTLNAKSIQNVFEAYAHNSSQEWVQSWWKLTDADADGLIDQEEMTTCVDLSLEPVHLALRDVFDIALEVCPVRTIGMGGEEEAKKKNAWFLGVVVENDSAEQLPTSIPPAKLSWRNRRKELKQRKILTKTLQNTTARHFRDQAEAPHRLRCIYAWAEKAHQDNKLDSILVDTSEDWGAGAASAVMGRKRYVELEPKISYSEFREVQKKSFPHLDKIGEEIITSFKEDLWLVQGTKRQNKELKRDFMLFLLGVSIVDLGISMA